MRLWFPARRATLLVPSGPVHDSERKHLFVLLTDPFDVEGIASVLMVSLSSRYPGLPYDPACLLYPGDHPFFTRESYVVYAKARIEPSEKLQRGVERGALTPKDIMDAGIFARISQGLETSRLTAPRMLTLYRKAGGMSA